VPQPTTLPRTPARKSMEENFKINTIIFDTVRFADYLVIISDRVDGLQKAFYFLEEVAKTYSLQFPLNKPKRWYLEENMERDPKQQ
jgi:hypothetical protein